MLSNYRNKLKYIRSDDLLGSELHIKCDGITLVDHDQKKVYKRVFVPNLRSILVGLDNLPLAPILEAEFNDLESEFVLEYVEGKDIFMAVKENPNMAPQILTIFESFLADWFNYDDQKNYIEIYSFDINPGNFVFNFDKKVITVIDYISNWGKTQKNIYFYLLPFVKILEHELIDQVFIENLINKRFKNHCNRETEFRTLYQELKSQFLDIEISD